MRILEIVLFVLLLLASLRLILRLQLSRSLEIVQAALLLLVLLLHLGLEKARWQMFPAYGLAVGLAAAAVYRGLAQRPARRSWPGWICLVLGVLAVLPAIAFPVPVLPAPDGPYAIGTTSFYWVDPARVDPYIGGARRLMVQVWYPAVPGSTQPLAPYLDRIETSGPVVAQTLGLPAFMLDHLGLTHPHSRLDAPALQDAGPFPVIIYSHGWTGVRPQATFLFEHLASHGYVIISADHTDGAAFVAFPDGSVVLNYPDALPENVPVEEYDQAARLLGQTWVADLRFLVDQAAGLQSGALPSPLQGLLDLERIGFIGHSTGGGAIVETCYLDTRCRAGVAMDAWLIPYDRQIPEQGLEQPFLFMNSELWLAQRNPPLAQALLDHMRGPVDALTIAGTNHYDFTDIPLLTPLAHQIDLKGPLPAARGMKIIQTYTLAFFDQVFKGQPAPVLQGDLPAFPEVHFVGSRH